MKLEVILNGIGSVTAEDDVNHSIKTVRKLTSFMLDELKRADTKGRRMGFEAGDNARLENNGHQHNDPVEMPGVIVR